MLALISVFANTLQRQKAVMVLRFCLMGVTGLGHPVVR